MHYICIFLEIEHSSINFSRVLTKTAYFLINIEKIWIGFVQNPIEKLEFIWFLFWKVVTKNRAFGNKNIFLQHFFGFEGGFPHSPLATPLHPGSFLLCCSLSCIKLKLLYYYHTKLPYY